MNQRPTMQQLQLLGIGRIDRCRSCPRYRVLRDHPLAEGGKALPAPPESCGHRVCRPLARRYSAALRIGDSKIA